MATPQPVSVGPLVLGAGRPALCVPLVGRTPGDMTTAAASSSPAVSELVELRVDYVDEVFRVPASTDAPSQPIGEFADLDLLERVVRGVRAALDDGIPLLVTLRTKPEGGERHVSPATYDAVLRRALATGVVDAIDVEMYTDPDVLGGLVDAAHDAGVVVVMSSHDFDGTPSQGEIVSRLLEQQENGADVVKFASMPRTVADVLTLVAATAEFRAGAGIVPAVTMSMGPLGVMTRLAGETFGSCLTFGAVGGASAPGQVPADALRATLDLVHTAQTG